MNDDDLHFSVSQYSIALGKPKEYNEMIPVATANVDLIDS